MYVRGGLRSGMSHGMALITYMHPTQGHRHRPYVRHTVWYMLDSVVDRGFFGDGDGGQGWRRGGVIVANTKQLLLQQT